MAITHVCSKCQHEDLLSDSEVMTIRQKWASSQRKVKRGGTSGGRPAISAAEKHVTHVWEHLGKKRVEQKLGDTRKLEDLTYVDIDSL